MSADTQTFDPYRSPTLPEVPYAPPPASGRPGWLTTLCVLCIVLGALGLMNALLGAMGAIAGSALQKAIQPKASASVPKGMQEAQEQFQDNINAVQAKYFWVSVPALGVRAVAAIFLLVGGIRALSLIEGGRQTLLIGLSIAVVFELLHAILQSVVAMDMMTVVNEYLEKVLQAIPKNNNKAENLSKIMPMVVRWSILGSIIFAFLIALAKISLYTFGLIYLRKLHIQALFQSTTKPNLAPAS